MAGQACSALYFVHIERIYQTGSLIPGTVTSKMFLAILTNCFIKLTYDYLDDYYES